MPRRCRLRSCLDWLSFKISIFVYYLEECFNLKESHNQNLKWSLFYFRFSISTVGGLQVSVKVYRVTSKKSFRPDLEWHGRSSSNFEILHKNNSVFRFLTRRKFQIIDFLIVLSNSILKKEMWVNFTLNHLLSRV